MPDGLTIVGKTEDGEPIYAAASDDMCPVCGDLLYELPNGQLMCGWCDILVGDAPKEESSDA